MSALIGLVLVLALAGFLVFLITTYVPMDPLFLTLIRVAVAVAAVLYLLSFFQVTNLHLR